MVINKIVRKWYWLWNFPFKGKLNKITYIVTKLGVFRIVTCDFWLCLCLNFICFEIQIVVPLDHVLGLHLKWIAVQCVADGGARDWREEGSKHEKVKCSKFYEYLNIWAMAEIMLKTCWDIPNTFLKNTWDIPKNMSESCPEKQL